MYICEAKAPPLMFEGQSLMIDTEQVQDSRLEVVYVYGFINYVISKFIGLSIRSTCIDTAAGHPACEAARMVVPAVVICCEPALAVVGAPKFSAPDNQCFIEHPPLFEVLDQCSRCLVCFPGLLLDAPWQSAVVIPALMEKLDKLEPAFSQPACKQAIGRKGTRLA